MKRTSYNLRKSSKSILIQRHIHLKYFLIVTENQCMYWMIVINNFKEKNINAISTTQDTKYDHRQQLMF